MVDFEKLRDLIEEVHKMDSLTERLTEAELRKYLAAPELEETANDSCTSIQDPMQCSYGL